MGRLSNGLRFQRIETARTTMSAIFLFCCLYRTIKQYSPNSTINVLWCVGSVEIQIEVRKYKKVGVLLIYGILT